MLWPHQQRAIDDVLAAIAAGERKICVTSPTGMGKTRTMAELIDHWCDQGLKTVLYTNRRLLVEQTSRVMAAHGIDHGMRAAGYEDEGYFPVAVSSIQTEDSRVFRKSSWQLHNADRVLIDEAHNQTAKVTRKILDAHLSAGAVYVGFTATPLDLEGLYDCLIQAGTMSEGRSCGALIPAWHYAPDEPDLHDVKMQEGVDLTEKQNRKAIMRKGIFGRVWEHWLRLNPERKPTILFAPGVRESIWLAEQFQAQGVSAAHIDGQEVWVNGRLERTSRQAREDVLGASKDGKITVLCNRFVLREGIDAPWLAHGIFATVFGSLQSYLQSGGRLLRAYPGLDSVTIQDHGGNWWRHGSLNADRYWQLGDTSSVLAGLRADRMRAKKEKEPYLCRCGLVLSSPKCRLCGWEVPLTKRSRPVVQTDGTLKEMLGDIYRPRRTTQSPDAQQIWERVYYRAKKSGMTFRQAEALYAKENNWEWPPRTLRLMPVRERDWFLPVSEVPVSELR